MNKYTWTDTVNNKLHFQISFAYDLGLKVPDFIRLESSSDAEKALLNPQVVIKEDIALARPLGTKVGFAAFFNGDKFVNYVGMIKDGFMFSGSQGLELHSNIMMLFPTRREVVSKIFKKAASVIKQKDEEFIGFMQVIATVDIDGDWWYESIQFGAEPEFLVNLESLLGTSVFNEPLSFPKMYSASVRIMPLAYPHSGPVHEDDVSFLQEIWDIDYINTDAVFFVSNTDSDIKATWRKLYHKCAGIERFSYLYRVDGETVCKERYHHLKENDLV